MGAPGVGKTHLVTRLSQQEGIFFFDRDMLYDGVFKDDRESPEYRQWTGPMTAVTWNIARDNARRGVSTILESPMAGVIQGNSGGFIDETLADAGAHDYNLTLIYCVAPGEVIRGQLESRGLSRDAPKYETWEEFLATFVNVPGPKYEHLKIDTTQPVERNLDNIMTYFHRR